MTTQALRPDDAGIAWPDGHRYVQLSDGLCHFRIAGPDGGAPLLAIHGATVPGWEFDRILPLLAAASLRIIVPDLWGHGYSDRPRTGHTHELFVRQMLELLDVLRISRPVHVLGHSLGAAIATRLACREPRRFGRLVLAAPLLRFDKAGPLLSAMRWPVLGELLMPTLILPLLVRRRARRYRGIEDGRFIVKFRQQLAKPYFGRSLLSLVRSGSLGDQSDCYRLLGARSADVMVIRGSADDIATAEQAAELMMLAPGLRYRELPGLPHAFILTAPDAVAREIVEFLQTPPAPLNSAAAAPRDRPACR